MRPYINPTVQRDTKKAQRNLNSSANCNKCARNMISTWTERKENQKCRIAMRNHITP